MRRAGSAAAAAVIGWYVFALWILHPLTDAPVVDSWLYGSAVRRFLRTGEIRFAGYTQAMPVAQVFYGVGWSRAFGGNSVSLEMSVVILAVLCGLMCPRNVERWLSRAPGSTPSRYQRKSVPTANVCRSP